MKFSKTLENKTKKKAMNLSKFNFLRMNCHFIDTSKLLSQKLPLSKISPTHLKIFFESSDDPPGFALRSSGRSPDPVVGDGNGRSAFAGVLTEGLAVRSGVVVGEIC
jgi:hypothetical protein